MALLPLVALTAVEGAVVGAYKKVEGSAVRFGSSFVEEYQRRKNKE